MGHLQRRTALMAAAVLVSAVALGVPPAAAAGSPTGFWEARGGSELGLGFQVHRSRRGGYVTNVLAPMRCSPELIAYGFSASASVLPIRRGGRFSGIAGDARLRGRFRRRRSAAVRLRMAGCGRALRTTLRPVRRRPVSDGDWFGLTESGRGMRFEVSGSGRVVARPFVDGPLPATCSDGQARSIEDADQSGFAPVRPSGTFSLVGVSESKDAFLSGKLKRRTARGRVGVTMALASPAGVTCRSEPEAFTAVLAFPEPAEGDLLDFPGAADPARPARASPVAPREAPPPCARC